MSRGLYTFSVALTVCTTVTTLVYWIEMVLTIESGLKLRFRAPSKTIKAVLLFLSFFIVVSDIVVSGYSFFGRIRGAITTVPAYAYLLCFLLLAVFEIHAFCTIMGAINKLGIHVAKSQSLQSRNIRRTDSIARSASVDRDEYYDLIKRKLRRALYFVLLDSFLLVFLIIGCIMVALNLQYGNSTLFGLVFGGLQLVEQLTSFSLIRILSVAIDKFGSDTNSGRKGNAIGKSGSVAPSDGEEEVAVARITSKRVN
jgi:hypothetical protein